VGLGFDGFRLTPLPILRVIFTSEPHINPEQLINLIQTQAQIYKFDGADKLRFIKPFENTEQKLTFINELLEKLSL
jgi:transcription-repair coupling factor (superfamily II helicase)